jgi:hypothetical protein
MTSTCSYSISAAFSANSLVVASFYTFGLITIGFFFVELEGKFFYRNLSTKSLGEGSGSLDSLERSSGAILASSSATRSSGDDFFSGSWLSYSGSYTTFGFITIFFFGFIVSLALGFGFILSITLVLGFEDSISFGSSSLGSSDFGSSDLGTSSFGSSTGVSSTGLAFFFGADFLTTGFLTAAFLGAIFFLVTFFAAFLAGFLAGFFSSTGGFHSVPSSFSLYVPLSEVISPESSLSDAFAYLSGSRVLASTATASSLISLLSFEETF